MSRADVFTNTPQDAARYEQHHALPDDFDIHDQAERDEPDDWFAAVMDDEPAEDPWYRLSDGPGSWTATAPHRRTQLTLLGTIVVCALLAGAFLGMVKAGRALMCETHRADGHGALTYCADYRPVQP